MADETETDQMQQPDTLSSLFGEQRPLNRVEKAEQLLRLVKIIRSEIEKEVYESQRHVTNAARLWHKYRNTSEETSFAELLTKAVEADEAMRAKLDERFIKEERFAGWFSPGGDLEDIGRLWRG